MLVQGIGDEVISVVIGLLFILLVSFLWLSTHVQERPPVRAVVIRSANSETIAEIQAPQPNTAPSNSVQNELQEAVEATEQSISDQSTSPVINDQATNNESNNSSETEPESNENLATIKVRFINETSLEIKERLSEKAGRFIHKHLDRHLNISNEDRVRLIYNGRVLGREQTLAEHGLTDNSVVHCLVQRGAPNNQDANPGDNQNQPILDEPIDLDLSSFCFPLLGALLMVIWWCQIVYAHYFNLTSTISLVSLTILFFATAVNTYLT